MYKYLPLIAILTGCIDDSAHTVDIPDLPCIDGWQFDHIGQPIINPNNGAQLTCE